MQGLFTVPYAYPIDSEPSINQLQTLDRDSPDIGRQVILFKRLFEENEDLLHLFEKFGELKTAEAQMSSEELAEHATKVMHTLDEGIKGLGDIDAFFAYIRHVGATHHQVPGFKAENFWKIEQPFLQAAKTTLADRYTPNIEEIYKKTIRFILENLVKGYEDSAVENGNGQS
ncbi:hypothetical protein HW555_000581 [Spodoptera exigua]|uniref:Globin domain-containing protein n=1 Tax=Spodoptera exigua TaxID=7107 RepID=A0A835L8P3_SPOEX|nr:hypothetical protein HW555_000581 [Spodoptera exigua]